MFTPILASVFYGTLSACLLFGWLSFESFIGMALTAALFFFLGVSHGIEHGERDRRQDGYGG